MNSEELKELTLEELEQLDNNVSLGEDEEIVEIKEESEENK